MPCKVYKLRLPYKCNNIKKVFRSKPKICKTMGEQMLKCENVCTSLWKWSSIWVSSGKQKWPAKNCGLLFVQTIWVESS